MGSRSDTPVAYAVLGHIAVEIEGVRRTVAGRQRLLLAHLLVERGRVVPADRLVDTLWSDALPDDPSAALRSQVSRLRRLVPAGDLLTDRGGYGLEIERSRLDATRFEDLVVRAMDEPPVAAAQLLADALALWQGPAFEPVADREFAQAEAARLDELRLAAVEHHAAVLLSIGDAADAASELVTLVRAHPEREHARALLMEVLYRAGRHTDALDLYGEWRDQLVDRGLEPSPELRAVEQDVLRHRVAPAPHARTPATVPRPVTSLIGREDDVDRVTGVVARSRLATLCGPGGVGKTRLALEAAARLADAGAGVSYCDLAAVTRDSHVVRAVAMAVGVERADTRPIEEHLIAHLGADEHIVVLDNCEHVIDAVARLTERLMRHAGTVRLLATSREPIRVDGERVVAVAPLPVGADSAAVALFLDRARDADPDIIASAENVDLALTICAQLDGLPLALELAAARLRSMTLRELAAVLEHGLEVLDDGPRAAARHRSLHSVIDWSYEQLDDPARSLFESLSVFVGAFDIEAAHAVAASDHQSLSRIAAGLTHLVDCSLVAAQRSADATSYRMLDTLRRYARARLDARGSADEARRRHATWAVSFAEAASRALVGADEGSGVRRIHDRFDDLRAAHEWLVGHDIEAALRLSAALHSFAMWRGHSEVFDWADVAIAAAGGTHASSLVPVLGSAAVGKVQRGELDAAEAAVRAALRATAHRSDAWIALEALADVHLLRGETDTAASLYLECHAAAIAAGDAPQAAWSLGSAALAHLYGGRSDDAVGIAATIVEQAQESQNPSAIAFAEFVVGEIAAAAGDDDAERHLQRAIDIAILCESRFVEGLARVTLATLRAGGSDVASALDSYAITIEHWSRHNAWAPQWVTLRNLVELLARHRAASEAAILYGAITASGTGPRPYGADERLLDDVRDRITAEIGSDAFADRCRHGASLPRDDIVAIALEAIERVRGSLLASELQT